MRLSKFLPLLGAVVLFSGFDSHGVDHVARTLLPTGQYVTPTATPGSTFQTLNPGLKDFPDFVVGQPTSLALTPDGQTLALLTSGYNNNYDKTGNLVPGASNEYVFLLDVSHGKAVQKQVIQIPDSYQGLTFTPDGSKLLASGGGDDAIHVFVPGSSGWTEASGSPIQLKHSASPSAPGVPPRARRTASRRARWRRALPSPPIATSRLSRIATTTPSRWSIWRRGR